MNAGRGDVTLHVRGEITLHVNHGVSAVWPLLDKHVQ